MQKYGEKLTHILVRNRGLKLNWSEIIEGDRLSKLRSKYQFLEIDFPGLRRTDIDFIDKQKQPFSQVMDSLPLLARQRVKTFLSDTMTAIESTGKFNSSSTELSEPKK